MLKAQIDSSKEIFLRAIATLGNITRASAATGIPSSSHYRWLKTDADYAAAYELAAEEASDLLENEAWRRGHDGVDKPIFYQGIQVATIREYSDSLLTLLLKARKPHVFGDKIRQELTGANGAPLMDYDITKLPKEKLEQIRDLLKGTERDETSDTGTD